MVPKPVASPTVPCASQPVPQRAQREPEPVPAPVATGAKRPPWRHIVAVSLAITVLCAPFAVLVDPFLPKHFLYAFVYVRWLAVTAVWLIALAAHAWKPLPLPRVLATPRTALALTAESIMFDMASARLP